ncbi:hypothetical protein HYQ44_016153 [Verticillium longisporum]|nr:hypothetical protein HYQ44_016153 [Verticillium longisporum]
MGMTNGFEPKHSSPGYQGLTITKVQVDLPIAHIRGRTKHPDPVKGRGGWRPLIGCLRRRALGYNSLAAGPRSAPMKTSCVLSNLAWARVAVCPRRGPMIAKVTELLSKFSIFASRGSRRALAETCPSHASPLSNLEGHTQSGGVMSMGMAPVVNGFDSGRLRR